MSLKNSQFFNYFTIEVILFLATFFFGTFSAIRIREYLSFQKIEIPQISLLNFLFGFFVATLFFFLIFQFLKQRPIKSKIYKTLFVLTSFFAGETLFESLFSVPISLILIFFFIFWWLKFPNVLNQNLLMIFGIAGISAVLGLGFRPEIVVLLLIFLSIYDFIAVYKTKHMVKIAKEMIEQKVIFGFVIPPNFTSFKESLKEVQVGGKFLILGGGDVALPLLLSVSLIPFGILKSAIVAIFSLFGVLANFYVFIKQKERKPIPALPLISLFSIIGYLTTLLLK